MEVFDKGSVLLLYVFVAAAAVQDLVHMKISNRLILAGAVTALICRMLQGGTTAIVLGLENMVFPVITLYLLFLAGILGAGDIKLFSVIGGFLSFRELCCCMILSFLAGALLALIRLAASGQFRIRIMKGLIYLADLARGKWHPYLQAEDEAQTVNRMHFSVAIAAGLIMSQICLAGH